MNLRRVVVTGLGSLTPIGNTIPEFWDGLKNGVSGAAPITKFDAEKFKTKFACEVKNFNVEDHIHRRDARRMDIFTHYALVVCEEAIQDAKINLETINKDRVGVIWGAGIGGLKSFQDEVVGFAKGDGTPKFSPFFIPKMIADLSSGHVSIKYGFRGPNYVTVSACASATNAMVDAFNYIRLGRIDMAVSGGSEAAVTETGIGGFNALKALSERNDSPETASRPFDKERDGFVLGEGGAAIILEEYEHAKARGAKIYAELVGGGMSSDAHHLTAPHPEGLGATKVMQDALNDAGITPEAIDYINVHGTSTPLGDYSEALAIQKVFGEHAYNLNISSTKSMTGHLLGAAGAIEAVATILAIQHQTAPPTINHFTDDEQFDTKLNFTFNEAQEREINYAMSNTFGFGGHNFTLVFKKLEM
ncbi:beta-ketoacyl-[acyl-carrier-protein] synthase II [marine bacterium AO1-C]|nr:beta-ketoacyl-[acyl-carrier-protein] synthase II [marine bacterium AO1-C]